MLKIKPTILILLITLFITSKAFSSWGNNGHYEIGRFYISTGNYEHFDSMFFLFDYVGGPYSHALTLQDVEQKGDLEMHRLLVQCFDSWGTIDTQGSYGSTTYQFFPWDFNWASCRHY